MSRYPINEVHDATRAGRIASANGRPDFPGQNLPYGIFSPAHGVARPCVALGGSILDLPAIARLLPDAATHCLSGTTSNALLAPPAGDRVASRHRLSELLSNDAYRAGVEPVLHPAVNHLLHLPAAIGD